MKNILIKKKYLIILAIVFIIVISIFFIFKNVNFKMLGIPKYDKSECFYSDSFKDYTDYCKYYYNEKSIKEFELNSKFKKVTRDDIENIKGYFEIFSTLVVNEKYYNNYDFDISKIKIDDYYYINDNKYDSYDVYYVDMENFILYFIHSNS